MMRGRLTRVTLLCLAIAAIASASWYDDYDAGVAAVRKGQWSVVVQKMTAAISSRGKENNAERSYGTQFINYHPYYYRGLAYLNIGKYEQAISDLEKASGPGEVDQGSIESLVQRAKSKLEAASATPEPVPAPAPPSRPAPVPASPVPAPATPAAPAIDPALRQRVANEIATARARMAAAQQRRASSSPQYSQAVTQLADATSRSATAKSNDDLNTASAAAQNAATFFDAATAPGAPPAPPPVAVSTPRPTKQTAATEAVLGDTRQRIRNALSSYFRGEFDEASRDFERLSKELPTNGWIWAFRGAADYSRFAFEGEENYKASALDAFRKAKKFRKWPSGLPERYFSKRIRKAFDSAS